MSEEEKIVGRIATVAQGCIQQHPVVILGSGASVVHGLRGMGDLAQYLLDHIDPDEGDETDAWLPIKTALAEGDGLEEALLKTPAAPPCLGLVKKIVAFTQGNRVWICPATSRLKNIKI